MKPTKEKLHQLHYIEYKQAGEIAKIYNISHTAVLKWFKRYDLQYHRHPQLALYTKEQFIQDYVVERKLLVDIYGKLGIHKTVFNRWLKCNDVDILALRKPSKEILLNLHHVNRMPMDAICKHQRCTFTTLVALFDEYGIEKRTYNEIAIDMDKVIQDNTIHNKSMNCISTELGVHVGTLSRHLKKRNVKLKNVQRLVVPTKETLFDLHHSKKYTIDVIANIFGVDNTTIIKWIKKRDVEQLYHQGSCEERILQDFLKENGILTKKWKFPDKRREVDMYSDTHKIGIEYCDAYWHTDRTKPTNFHYTKFKECERLGIHLITIFDFEMNDIVKSIILSKFGVFERKIFARNCHFKEISKEITNAFLRENHLQGAGSSIKHSFGLFHADGLVAVLTYTKHHRQGYDDCIVLSRLCFKKNTLIVGGASKLFSNSLPFLSHYESIISWSDNRWSDGGIYRTLGFDLNAEYRQDYFYIGKNGEIKSKQSMKKSATGCPQHITEREFCLSLGYERIYDCGKKKWVYQLT